MNNVEEKYNKWKEAQEAAFTIDTKKTSPSNILDTCWAALINLIKDQPDKIKPYEKDLRNLTDKLAATVDKMR